MTRVMALSGWKRSGKDTCANYLHEVYGYIPMSFAKKLKDIVSVTYNIPRAHLDDQDKKEMPLYNYPVITTDTFTAQIHKQLESELRHGYWTPRALCILEGSIKRAVYPNYWVREIAQEIINNPGKSYVITDMRYTSEADTLRALLPAIKLIRVQRHDNIETQDPSERDLDKYPFDVRLDNTGSMLSLQNSLDNMVRVLAMGGR